MSGSTISDIGVRWTWMSDIMSTNSSDRGNPGLKALRERAGLNKQEMAKAVGVAPRMWQRYENEGRLPEKLEVVLRISVLSKTPMDEVVKTIGFDVPNREELIAKAKSSEVL